MGTGVIFYEEIAEDIVQTWDQFDTLFAERLRIRVLPTQLPFRYPLQSFLFDPDRPCDLPISAIRPDGGILHPPPAPVDTGVIGEPYDPLYDLAGFIDEYYRRPPEAVPAQMEVDPVEDPMDTDTGEDEDPEKAEQSEDSEDTRSDERSVVSTDTCESRA
ncbi:hypothetical protein PIB30_110092 [Stylosanthes scabra]|uniref:Uncharacterized protein n=1 Tax=Stylosanthes scabra TaxID=79078 RepID=A0ABU6W206_9FABA|nr:hypothetical protein [Stylosanthes scabra]